MVCLQRQSLSAGSDRALRGQTLIEAGDAPRDGPTGFLDVHEVQGLTARLAAGCGATVRTCRQRRLSRAVHHPGCPGLPLVLRRPLVRHRRRRRQCAAKAGFIAAGLSLVLQRAAYAGFSGPDGASASARCPDRRTVRAWAGVLGHRDRHRLAPVAVLLVSLSDRAGPQRRKRMAGDLHIRPNSRNMGLSSDGDPCDCNSISPSAAAPS